MFRTASWAALAVGLLLVASALLALGVGCDGSSPPAPPTLTADGGGTPDAGRRDGGAPDAGGGPPDAGAPPDAGQGPTYGAEGPWPLDAVKSYSAAYQIGVVQSVSVDDAYNIWLLDGARIGVLRPGATSPAWSKDLGQAGRGFPSTVICGGRAGQAFVGYLSSGNEERYLDGGFRRAMPSEGDADSVAIGPDGAPAFEEHLNLYNSNDLHWNEASTVLSCMRVFRGPAKGDVFFGNDHGVTRVRAQGCEAAWANQPRHQGYATCYNDHRHPSWYADPETGQWVRNESSCGQLRSDGTVQRCSLRVGYNYALGVAWNGDILMGNEWKIGQVLTTPDPALSEWDRFPGPNPWRINWYVPELSSMEEFDNWRGFTQAADGLYYLGSADHGLWELTARERSGDPRIDVMGARKISNHLVSALVATDDGSVFIGTSGSGLWRLTPTKALEPVSAVKGSTVRALVYDPTVSPAMLYVATSAGLYVLRGH